MAGYWMTFLSYKKDGKTQFGVKYSTPTLGFTVEEVVDEDTQRMLQIAVEVGKEQMKSEIHELLRLR